MFRGNLQMRPHACSGSLSRMVRFVHTSDWQLGMTRHFLRPEAQARFSAARIEAVKSVGRIAKEDGCAFVVVAGDVFESNMVERAVVVRALEAMREAGVDFYLLPGNHDPLGAGSVFHSPAFTGQCPANVHVLGAEPVQIAAGVTLVGDPWMAKRREGDPIAGALARARGIAGVRIIVGHGNADALVPDLQAGGLVARAEAEGALARGDAQYIALGDRHSRTALGDNGKAWYSGSPEPTDYDETDPGWVLVADVERDHCVVEPVRTGTWAFAREHFNLAGAGDLGRVRAWLDGRPNKDRTIVKLSFTGTLNLAARAELDEMLAHYEAMFAAIEQWERRMDLVVQAEGDEFTALGLAGFAAGAAEELAALSRSDSPQAGDAGNALALLYRLARNGP